MFLCAWRHVLLVPVDQLRILRRDIFHLRVLGNSQIIEVLGIRKQAELLVFGGRVHLRAVAGLVLAVSAGVLRLHLRLGVLILDLLLVEGLLPGRVLVLRRQLLLKLLRLLLHIELLGKIGLLLLLGAEALALPLDVGIEALQGRVLLILATAEVALLVLEILFLVLVLRVIDRHEVLRLEDLVVFTVVLVGIFPGRLLLLQILLRRRVG